MFVATSSFEYDDEYLGRQSVVAGRTRISDDHWLLSDPRYNLAFKRASGAADAARDRAVERVLTALGMVPLDHEPAPTAPKEPAEVDGWRALRIIAKRP